MKYVFYIFLIINAAAWTGITINTWKYSNEYERILNEVEPVIVRELCDDIPGLWPEIPEKWEDCPAVFATTTPTISTTTDNTEK